MSLRRAASLSIVALLSVTGASADVRGGHNPPLFTTEEIELIGRDRRLVAATEHCAWQLRQSLAMLTDASLGSRVGVQMDPCRLGSDGRERASDEGALDILKILKEASEQGTSRVTSVPGHGSATAHSSPSFTSEEVVIIHRDGRLMDAVRHCSRQLRRAFDVWHGRRPAQTLEPCRLPAHPSTRGTDEGALDILKILREASGEGTSN